MHVRFSENVLLVSGEQEDCTYWAETYCTEKARTLEAFRKLGPEGVVTWVKNLHVRAQFPSDDLSDTEEDDSDEEEDLEPVPPIPTEGFLREEVTGEELLETDEFNIDDVLNRCDVDDARHLYAVSRALEQMRDGADDDGGMWETVAQIELFKSKHGLGKAKLHIDPELDKVFKEVQRQIEKVFVDVREHSTWRSADIVNAFERVIALSEDCIRENHLKPKQEQVIIDAAQGVRHRLDELRLIEDCIPEPGEQLEEDEIENLLQEIVEVVTEANDLFLLVNLVGCMKVMAAPRYEEVFDAFEKSADVLENFQRIDADLDTSVFDNDVEVATVHGHIANYEEELYQLHPYVMTFPALTAKLVMSALSLVRKFTDEIDAAGGGMKEIMVKILVDLKGYIGHMLVCERGHAAVVDAETADESVESIKKLLSELKQDLGTIFGAEAEVIDDTSSVDTPRSEATESVVSTPDKNAEAQEETQEEATGDEPKVHVEMEFTPMAAAMKEGDAEEEVAVSPPRTARTSIQKSTGSDHKSKMPMSPPAVPVDVALEAASNFSAAEPVVVASLAPIEAGPSATHSNVDTGASIAEVVPGAQPTEMTGADEVKTRDGDEMEQNAVTFDQAVADKEHETATMGEPGSEAKTDVVRRRVPESTTDDDLDSVSATESTRLLSSVTSEDDETEESTCWKQFIGVFFGN